MLVHNTGNASVKHRNNTQQIYDGTRTFHKRQHNY